MSKHKHKRKRYLHDMGWPTPRSGRPVRETVVLPTTELTLQRLRASGRADVPDEFPLDSLEARGAISSRQAQAGRYLAAARYRLFGRPPGSVAALYRRMLSGLFEPARIQGEDDVESYRRRRRIYQEAIDVLKAQGQTALHTTMRVAVYLERPRWLQAAIDRTPVGSLAAAEHEALERGLAALADHYKLPLDAARPDAA